MNDTSFDPTPGADRATALREVSRGENYNHGNGLKMGTTNQMKIIRTAENPHASGLCRLLPV